MERMPKKMSIEQGDVLLFPYPFTNLSGSKIRPALVVSNNNFNKTSSDCIAVPLTTVLKEVPHSIIVNQENLSHGNLIRPSRIRADTLFTLEKTLIKAKVAKLKNKTFTRVKSEINKLF